MSAQRGFTLIELLVVIAIMGIVGAFALANFRSFGDDQNLKNGLLDIQSFLRTAQSNAATNVKCDTGFNATWTVEFSSITNLDLKCTEPQASANSKKSATLGSNLQIEGVAGTGTGCPSSVPFSVKFSLQNNRIDLGDARCTSVTVTIKNNKGSNKALIIEQGGRIYEKTN
jgi:prepilin-type N-terminal cleavage/methylation domain-containing protein